ncbi:hypothetical protein ACLH2N_06620, partial [Klebsiella grimontii]|uniref:hypothetical protein n=1 Tax=Klebsiella grimontii TaxID=2058152 RepID=UPI003983DAA9
MTGSFIRLALRLAGLRVHSVLRDGSPDRRASAASGEGARPDTSARFLPGGAAPTGLRVHSVLRDGSPDRRASAASGEGARPDTS